MHHRVVIVGAGITGLAAAVWLEREHGIDDVLVLETSGRAGGKIFSEVVEGHCIEWGPQGFLDNAPDTLDLVEICNLRGRVVRSDERAADRFIVRKGLLRSVPTSPLSFLGSGILPFSGRLRVLLEVLARPRPEGDETVFDFARRRIGRQAAEILVDSMVTGVFAGDSRALSLAATFPRMASMEAEYGSLTRALVAVQRDRRRTGRATGGPSGPSGTLCTFEQGMAELPRGLTRILGDRLRLRTPVTRLSRRRRGAVVSAKDLEITADAVLVALPADQTAQLVAEVAPQAAPHLNAIHTAPIAVVMSSYRDRAAFGVPLEGFGFLVPRTESLSILGTLFCHGIFPDQAPADRLFLRTMIGGARDPDAVRLDDDELIGRVRHAHHQIFGHDPAPDRVWLVRWNEGITQYTVGHLDRVRAIESSLSGTGIEVAGSAFRGVSVNDCIKQARGAAARIAASLVN
jgi:oxygen-dependent protoporphyrinogen oxidase